MDAFGEDFLSFDSGSFPFPDLDPISEPPAMGASCGSSSQFRLAEPPMPMIHPRPPDDQARKSHGRARGDRRVERELPRKRGRPAVAEPTVLTRQMVRALQISGSLTVEEAQHLKWRSQYGNQRVYDVGNVLVWAGVASRAKHGAPYVFAGEVTDEPIELADLAKDLAMLRARLEELEKQKAEMGIPTENPQ